MNEPFDSSLNVSGKQDVAEPRVSFASQILSGASGEPLRRRSCSAAEAASMVQKSIALGELTLEDVLEEEEDECKETPMNASFGARRMSASTMRLHGIADKSSQSLFMSTMGINQKEAQELIKSRKSNNDSGLQTEDVTSAEREAIDDPYNLRFESRFQPEDMRCLALVAHNHMKPAMKEFVLTHKEILKKFRLTGTNTTITMLKEAFGDDPAVQYGPAFSSGPLGGDAELCALMCLEDLGGIFFFMDPLSAHPHQADIDSLVRLANVHNILTCINPCTAHAMSFLLKCSLEQGRKDKIPSFFFSLKSPGVAVYKAEQKKALEQNKTSHARDSVDMTQGDSF